MTKSKPQLDQKTQLEQFAEVALFYEQYASWCANAAAGFYENRGQIEQALSEWRVAQALDDEQIDSKACQALLKSVNANDSDRLSEQRRWADKHAISLDDDGSVRFRPLDDTRKITIGYLCCWWDSSTIRGQGIPFISHHDRSKFRIIGYSLGPCGDDITQHFDEFVDIHALSHEEFARRVRDDGVDALLEFTGFSPHHRFAAMGARCAPVQISYLNHAGTCGIANVDYVLADEISALPHLDENYTEEIWRLPVPFFNFNYDWDDFPDPGPLPYLRNEVITFGCFGSQSKINDAQIHIWSEMLNRIPNSRLFLRNMGLSERHNRDFMIRRFAQWGVPEHRLRLEAGGDRRSILENYAEVDISLDTWPYNGGNTIAESIWQGVPVITLAGDSFVSTYGASLLHGSGCPDMVARSPEEFYEIAARVAGDIDRLVHLRKNLRSMMHEHGFADSRRFARNMEEAITAMVRRALPVTDGADETGRTSA